MAYSGKRVFTKEDLKKYDGSNGVAYVAFGGKVYDVSRSFYWKRGIHQVIHRAGYNLTRELEQAPHGPELLDKFPVVGELLDPG